MLDKKRIWFDLKRLQSIKTWQLVIIFILACFIAATFLRLNNIGMVERRTAVINADNAGDESSVRNRLYDLQRYVSSHMNADMGKGVYLEASYKRAVQAAYEKVSSGGNPNGNIYKKAQETCAPRFSSWSLAYVQCTADELGKYPAGSSLVSSIALPKADMYLHSFVSPLWTPDFAGFSVLICVVIFIIILTRLTGVIILRILLKRRYQSI